MDIKNKGNMEFSVKSTEHHACLTFEVKTFFSEGWSSKMESSRVAA